MKIDVLENSDELLKEHDNIDLLLNHSGSEKCK